MHIIHARATFRGLINGPRMGLFIRSCVFFYFQVMQKSCRCGFMYGELTDKETIARIEECLEGQIHDQFEILLYKKNS